MARHVYHLKLLADGSVRPFIGAGAAAKELGAKDLDWTAGDSVSFKPEDARLKVRVQLVMKNGAKGDSPLGFGNTTITNDQEHNVPTQSHKGSKAFFFHCTLVDEANHIVHGWKTAKDDKASGSQDGNVHN